MMRDDSATVGEFLDRHIPTPHNGVHGCILPPPRWPHAEQAGVALRDPQRLHAGGHDRRAHRQPRHVRGEERDAQAACRRRGRDGRRGHRDAQEAGGARLPDGEPQALRAPLRGGHAHHLRRQGVQVRERLTLTFHPASPLSPSPSPLTAHRSPLTAHHSPFTLHRPPHQVRERLRRLLRRPRHLPLLGGRRLQQGNTKRI